MVDRPRYHLSPPANWLSDPNGLVWADGLWHLYYQHNPHDEDWGHMSWGHACSPNLVDWHDLPPAIFGNDRHFIFSGCAAVDRDGSAGFGADCLIALFTAAHVDGSRQAQHLAISHDGGRSFVEPDINPVLDLGLRDFRDPNIFWHDPTGRWVMVVARSIDHRASLYASPDLRDWTHLSDIGPWGAPGEVWECPMLIELPVEGRNETRWLFKVDALHGAPGSGALALTGSFDGTEFRPDPGEDGADWQVVDLGSDFYAAVPWHEPRDEQGRPAWIGWTGNHGYQGRLPRRGWRGAMSSPRRLSLRPVGSNFALVQQVEPALAQRFAALDQAIDGAAPCIIPLATRLSFAPDPASPVVLDIMAPDGALLRIEIGEGLVRVDRTTGFDERFDRVQSAALGGGPVTIWLDGGIVEIESGNGQHWLSAQHRLFGPSASLTVSTSRPVSIELSTFRPSAGQPGGIATSKASVSRSPAAMGVVECHVVEGNS